MKTLCMLGRQPAISLAELESLYGSAAITVLNEEVALVHASPDISRLGGTQKIAQLYSITPDKGWQAIEDYLAQTLPEELQNMPDRKIHLGLSVYGINISPKQLQRTGLTIKKALKKAGRSVRVVPNKQAALSSAQVYHNHFTEENGAEIIIAKGRDEKLYIGKTIAVQDIDSYRQRDQERPKRDAKVGMLPPKLAQIIVNLAVGTQKSPNADATQENTNEHVPENSQGLDVMQGKSEAQNETYDEVRRTSTGNFDAVERQEQKQVMSSAHEQAYAPLTILDPFCGTGVVLQEALLMGHNTYGTDIESRMIEYTRENIVEWLPKQASAISDDITLEIADATTHHWDSIRSPFDVIAAESYLGRPFSAAPKPEVLEKVMQDVDTIHKKFLQNVAQQTAPGFRMCLAVPAWHVHNRVYHLKTLDSLEKLGYTRQSFVHADDSGLVYRRPDQIVGRELTVLIRN